MARDFFRPCSVWCGWERYKTLPAGAKCVENGYFGRAGRVLYRLGSPRLRAGRVLYRHRPRVRYKVLPARSVGGWEREKVRPASSKQPKISVFWRAGRVFSRVSPRRPRAGRVFSRSSLSRACAGRTLSRVGPRRPHAGRPSFGTLCPADARHLPAAHQLHESRGCQPLPRAEGGY